MAGTDLVALSRDITSRLRVPPLIRLNGKAALDADWPRGPHDDPELWQRRLEGHTGNVGIVTGCSPDRTGPGLLVCDYDIYKAEGQLSYEAAQDLGWTVDTPTVQTQSGGYHLLLRYDPATWVVRSKDLRGKPIPGSDSTFPGGFEIKAEGGYVVWYGTWLDGQSLDDMPIADAPESLLELVGMRIDPDTGDVAGTVNGPWSSYDPELVHPDTARAVAILIDQFGGTDPIVVRSGPEPSVEIRRPGKTTPGRSATVGWLKPGLVKVFTDGWHPFEQQQVIDLGELERLAGIEHEPQVTVPSVLPDGYRPWHPDDGIVPAPTLDGAAFHGPIGDYLEMLDGQTEAHPAAVGAHLLAGIATLIGRNATYAAGSIRHRSNIFTAVVGPTSTGAKGVAEADANRLLEKIEPAFHQRHTLSGIGSGEMLVWEVRDPKPDSEDETDQHGGVKERIAQNAELSAMFKVAGRDGSILSDQLRLAFDGAPMRHSTKAGGVVTAVGHHISIVGSITPGELVKLLDDTARINGFGNRFLYLWSEMGELLPFGGDINPELVAGIADGITNRIGDVGIRSGLLGYTEYPIDPTARDTWASFYRRARRGIGDGIAADMTARSVAHAARIALIYAVLDGADTIRTEHIAAAEAWVNYGAATVEKVFGGGVTGLAGLLLAAIRDAGPDGLTLTEQSEVFSRNRTADELTDARMTLEHRRLIHTTTAPAAVGRPARRSFAICPQGTPTKERKKRTDQSDPSFNSFFRGTPLDGET